MKRGERAIIEGVEYISMSFVFSIIFRTVFFIGLGLGIGIVLSLPWLYSTQSLLAEQNKVELERCKMHSARVMVAVDDVQRTCAKQAMRVNNAGMGGE